MMRCLDELDIIVLTYRDKRFTAKVVGRVGKGHSLKKVTPAEVVKAILQIEKEQPSISGPLWQGLFAKLAPYIEKKDLLIFTEV